jgi:hypothetical protein
LRIFVPDAFSLGYYAFGANQLDVVAAPDRMLKYLEQHHSLVITDGGSQFVQGRRLRRRLLQR